MLDVAFCIEDPCSLKATVLAKTLLEFGRSVPEDRRDWAIKHLQGLILDGVFGNEEPAVANALRPAMLSPRLFLKLESAIGQSCASCIAPRSSCHGCHDVDDTTLHHYQSPKRG
jgi:hypothetical protein